MQVYQSIARSLVAIENCRESNNTEWLENHSASIRELVKARLPSGSGFDNGTVFDFDSSKPDKLIFHTSYHHMNDVGYYDGWSDHTVTVVPSLAFGFELKISGRDRNDIKEYIAQSFHDALSGDVAR